MAKSLKVLSYNSLKIPFLEFIKVSQNKNIAA